ncbi:MAG TPA: MFS transporter [Bryobacteraceae bacterium]|nr:MFS transporter [Bryobacteraceae bacterium]
MSAFTQLLRNNRNYRFTWAGQVVSEVGDHFNNIAVMSLAMTHRDPGLVVTFVFLSRAVAMLGGGPIAGVLLDRLNRKYVMMASDLVRCVIALGFILCVHRTDDWLLYVLSAMLMFASPFFTSGRASILPSIATKEELHTANTMTQTTSWASLTVGAFLGAVGVSSGYDLAFVYNALSFLVSFACIWQLRHPSGFRAEGATVRHEKTGFAQYREGLRYMRKTPLVAGIAMISLGWASGGGAAQILFSLFGEKVFNKGAMGIGTIWGFAGVGLLIGASIAYRLGKRLSFNGYKRTIPIVYVIHGGAYVIFSQMPTIQLACVFIAMSRAAVSISSVLNYTQLLHHVEDQYRGRVFATLESLTWSMMMISMMAAGAASVHFSPRTIGAVSGAISSTTAFFWWWANWRGKLPEPAPQTVASGADEELVAEPPLGVVGANRNER